MRPFLVCPFHRPGDVPRILSNWRRQLYGCVLIVIENGAGVGAFPEVPGVVRLVSSPHQSAAKNAGIDWLEQHNPGACWITLDGDDWYGPEYVGETVAALERGVLVGKASVYMLTVDASRVWLFADWQPGRQWEFLAGGTLAARVSSGLRFRDTGPQGEDWDLVRRVVRAGDICWSTGAAGYLWRRDGGAHACGASDAQLRQMARRGVTEWRVSGVAEAVRLASEGRRDGEHRCTRGCQELGCPHARVLDVRA